MNAIDTLQNILNSKHLPNYDFKYCLVDENKLPHRIDGKFAKPNDSGDFTDLDTLCSVESLDRYKGIGISIQASKISAIDVDSCFKEQFNINTADERAKYVLDLFKDKAYIEFSFSGKGLRILFKSDKIEHYSKKYYTKNSNVNIEYYQPSGNARYVTLTGKTIYDNDLCLMKDNSTVITFLDKYMVRPIIEHKESVATDDDKSIEELLQKVRNLYILKFDFQELWFGKAEGSKNGESEHDFFLLQYIYQYITTNKEKARQIFELSPRFKTKDKKHLYKWNYNNYRYFDFMWSNL